MNGGSEMMKDIFQELYERYHKDLYQFVFYMVKDKDTTEDLVQEIYIKVLKSYHSFEGKSSEKTWLFSIARHVTIDFFRKNGRRKKHVLTNINVEEHEQFIRDEQPLPEQIVERGEEIQHLYQCLDECTDDQKMVVVLRYIQGMSIKETAKILKWSSSKVKTTQHRAILQLKEKMDRMKGGTEY